MNRLKRQFYMLLRLALGLGLLAYLSASDVMDWGRLAGLGRAWPLALAALGCLALAAIVLGAWRLCLLMRPHRLHLSFAASVRLTLIGLFFNTCLPGATGGDVVKIFYAMQGNRGRRLEIGTVMMLDRVAGLLGILSFTLVLAFFFRPMLAAFSRFKRSRLGGGRQFGHRCGGGHRVLYKRLWRLAPGGGVGGARVARRRLSPPHHRYSADVSRPSQGRLPGSLGRPWRCISV